MWGKVIGGGVILALASLLFWGYGKARFNAGQLDERVKWAQASWKQSQEWRKRERELMEKVGAAQIVYVDRTVALQPIIQKSKETVREYAKTDSGRQLCLPYDRVLGVEQTRGELFTDYSAAPVQGSGALPPAPTSPAGPNVSGR